MSYDIFQSLYSRISRPLYIHIWVSFHIYLGLFSYIKVYLHTPANHSNVLEESMLCDISTLRSLFICRCVWISFHIYIQVSFHTYACLFSCSYLPARPINQKCWKSLCYMTSQHLGLFSYVDVCGSHFIYV